MGDRINWKNNPHSHNMKLGLGAEIGKKKKTRKKGIIQAYDSVWRPKLFGKLKKLGFGGKTLRLIRSMYRNDSIRFLVNGRLTAPIYLLTGVKQGKEITVFYL